MFCKGSKIPWKIIGEAPHIEQQSLSKTSLVLIRDWVESCLGQQGRHANCDKEMTVVLPKRVIFIDPVEPDTIRLYVPSNGETGRYIALSHCWGGSTPTMTTKKTLNPFIKSIPTPLPKTFQDAVITTKALGIPYLWIDSLCIVQDSPEDWSEQAPQMAAVYGNAYIVIAADAASDSTQGFLDPPSRRLNRSVRIPYEDMTSGNAIWIRQRGSLSYQLAVHGATPSGHVPSKRQVQVELRRRTKEARAIEENKALGIPASPFWSSDRPMLNDNTPFGEVLPSDFIKNDADKIMDTLEKVCRDARDITTKLSTRGWAFQERVLSPRTLHFGESEIGWECLSIISCECSARGKRYHRTESLLKKASMSMSWVDVVTEYSRMGLTVADDRLAALSGLASVRREAMQKQRYIAGMWEGDLPRQIAWYVKEIGVSNGLFKKYIAPSWSWASVTGPVVYHHKPDLAPHFTIQDIRCQHRAASSFTDCEVGAYLLVKGLLVPVDLGMDNSSIMPSVANDDLKETGRFQDSLLEKSPGKMPEAVFNEDHFVTPLLLGSTAPIGEGRLIRRRASVIGKPTVWYDTIARRNAVTQCTDEAAFAFFIINSGTAAPHGMLLMACNCEQRLPQEITSTLALQCSVSGVCSKYKRVGYIFTEEFKPPYESWSRSPDFYAQNSSEVEFTESSTTRGYWESFASSQTFALY